ncbi:MAG: TFIIB-type zinc ribbon-containing protein [Oscillospiraceae bacterium]|nr:TFIIB-type zinc ribbon-containing protein [Oscillospiraceae bacterium]
MQKKSTSWGIIALWLILFFPVGIFFIVKKMTGDKFSYIKNGKALKNLGVVLICFAGLYLIMLFTGDLTAGPVLSIILIFGGSGALCLYKGMEYIKRGTKYNRYVAIINASNDLLVDNIAAAVPTTYDQAVKDIQSMLDDGFFMNAYLDLNKRELIMAKAAPQPNVIANNMFVGSQGATNNQPHSVKCPNCGATNTVVPGAKNECEYCGSPL